MRGLGIVGAAAGLHPGSRALSAAAGATFPSRQSEGEDGRFHLLAGWSDGRPQALGARAWRLGIAKGIPLSLATDCAESHPRLGRNQLRASGGRQLLQPGTLVLPIQSWSEATASPGGQRNRSGGAPDLLEQRNSEAKLLKSSVYYNRAERLCAPPSARPSAQLCLTPICNGVRRSPGCSSSARGVSSEARSLASWLWLFHHHGVCGGGFQGTGPCLFKS